MTLCCCCCFRRCSGSAHTTVVYVSVVLLFLLLLWLSSYYRWLCLCGVVVSVVALAQLILPLVVSLCCGCFCCCSGSAHTTVGCVSVLWLFLLLLWLSSYYRWLCLCGVVVSVVALAQLIPPLVVSLWCCCFCCCSGSAHTTVGCVSVVLLFLSLLWLSSYCRWLCLCGVVVSVVALAQLIRILVVTLCCWLCVCRCCGSVHTAVGCEPVLLALFLSLLWFSSYCRWLCLCVVGFVPVVVVAQFILPLVVSLCCGCFCRCCGSAHTAVGCVSVLLLFLSLLWLSSYCRWLCLCAFVVSVVVVVQLIRLLIVSLCCGCFCRCCGSAHTAVGCDSVLLALFLSLLWFSSYCRWLCLCAVVVSVVVGAQFILPLVVSLCCGCFLSLLWFSSFGC